METLYPVPTVFEKCFKIFCALSPFPQEVGVGHYAAADLANRRFTPRSGGMPRYVDDGGHVVGGRRRKRSGDDDRDDTADASAEVSQLHRSSPLLLLRSLCNLRDKETLKAG